SSTTAIYPLSLHDALPILDGLDAPDRDLLRADLADLGCHDVAGGGLSRGRTHRRVANSDHARRPAVHLAGAYRGHPLVVDRAFRSEEHTSELQSLRHLVCR